MGFHWSLSDTKSPQVSWTLLGILVGLSNAAAWMISTHPLISKSSSSCANPLVTVTKASITIGVTASFMCLSLFQFTSKVENSTSFFSLFFFFFFWLLQGLVVWPRLSDPFVHLILQYIFWVVHIPFDRMVKFQFLVQFPVDHIAKPVVSSLILFFC